MNLNKIEITDHFITRAKQRYVPDDLIKDCLKYGKRKRTSKNILVDNKLIICCLSALDKAALTVKYSKGVKSRIDKDAKIYGTKPEKIAKIYFESLGYKYN